MWLERYWQDPRIVQCTDKLAVRHYIISVGLKEILNEVYAVYSNSSEIDFSVLPNKFVLKLNHLGGGSNIIICKDKSQLDYNKARYVMQDGISSIMGISTCEYHYQYIKPQIYAEKLIEGADSSIEIQFFCFNGKARHILVRTDLMNPKEGFAISYDLDWNRMHDRITEDMTKNIPRPKRLHEMISMANIIAKPFPQVRVDLYYVDETIIFGEMTFSTSGNILRNYTPDVVSQWGKELILPSPLHTKWKKHFGRDNSKGKMRY